MTYRRNWGVAGGTPPGHAGPNWERLWGPADLLPTGHSPTSNPAESATLRLPNTSIRNVGTRLGLSARSKRSRDRLTAGPGAGGMAQAAKARGNARDTPTWATRVGRKRSESECTRHEPGADARV
jgi:hypothetical protein